MKSISTIEQKKQECWEEFQVANRTTLETTKQAFEYIFDRAYALGKQEKDAEKLSSLEEEIHTYAKMCSFTESDYKAIRKAVEHGISLAKSEAEDTVISGWVARDANPHRLYVYYRKPIRLSDMWTTLDESLKIDSNLFPDITWESELLEVEIIIKRKKNG